MGFCLLRRDGDVVALIASSVFTTRAEALSEVSVLSAAGVLDADEVFLLDLDAAMPVLIVPQAPLEEAAPVDHIEPEQPEELLESPEPDPAQEDPPLAEDSAPEPIPAVIEVETAIAEAVMASTEEETASSETAPSDVEAETPLAAERPESAADAVAAQSWPWDVEQAQPDDSAEARTIEDEPLEPEAETDAEEEPHESETAEVNEEPVPDEVELEETVVAAPEAPEQEAVAEQAEAIPEEPVEIDSEELPDEVSGLLADLEELVPTVDDEGSVPVLVAAPVAAQEAASSPGAEGEDRPAKAYEAGGSDITELTCEDCIYLNTCPKKDESDPSSCGSFQWKSV